MNEAQARIRALRLRGRRPRDEVSVVWAKPPNPEQARKALAELRTLKGRIVSEHE